MKMSDYESMLSIMSKSKNQNFEAIPFFDIMTEDGDVITGKAIRVEYAEEETFIMFNEEGMII